MRAATNKTTFTAWVVSIDVCYQGNCSLAHKKCENSAVPIRNNPPGQLDNVMANYEERIRTTLANVSNLVGFGFSFVHLLASKEALYSLYMVVLQQSKWVLGIYSLSHQVGESVIAGNQNEAELEILPNVWHDFIVMFNLNLFWFWASDRQKTWSLF